MMRIQTHYVNQLTYLIPGVLRERAEALASEVVEYVTSYENINDLTQGNTFALFDVVFLTALITDSMLLAQTTSAEVYDRYVSTFYPEITKKLSNLGRMGTNIVSINEQLEDRYAFWCNYSIATPDDSSPDKVIDGILSEFLLMIDHDITFNNFAKWGMDTLRI